MIGLVIMLMANAAAAADSVPETLVFAGESIHDAGGILLKAEAPNFCDFSSDDVPTFNI